MIKVVTTATINIELLEQNIKNALPSVDYVSWDKEQFISVYGATEADRPTVDAILAIHDPGQETSTQQAVRLAAQDKDIQFLFLADSPSAYNILEGDEPVTSDDMAVLARLVRYMWKKLDLEPPDWTLAARS